MKSSTSSASAPSVLPAGTASRRRLASRRLLLIAALPALIAAAPLPTADLDPALATPAAPAVPAVEEAPLVPGAPAAAAVPTGLQAPAVVATPAVHAVASKVALARPALGRPALSALSVPAVFRQTQGLSRRALAAALDAISCARVRGIAGKDALLTLIDYSLPSTEPRLWVLDLARGRVLFHELVAHGAGSGENFATRFSNAPDSRQTSLGLFLTGDTYEGGNGYSLRLRGLDAGVNDRAEQRNIVMHGAWYVSADQARRYGRLGRSWGCPALPVEIAHSVIDRIKGGSFVFSYRGGVSSSNLASSPAACAAPSSPNPPAPAPSAPVMTVAAALKSAP